MNSRKLYLALAILLFAGLNCQQMFPQPASNPPVQSQPAQTQPQASANHGSASQNGQELKAKNSDNAPAKQAQTIEQPRLAAAIVTSKPAVMPIVSRVETEDASVVVKLENGLTVIVKRVSTTPVVHVKSIVHAGSMYEKEFLGSGISHLVEHLVAEGAEQEHKNPEGNESRKADDRIQKIGGQSNASTSIDNVTYFISAASSKTNDCIDLVADWMSNARFTAEDFKREHGVVQRELERSQDNPGTQLYHANARAVFGQHPAGVPVIGYKEPLAALTYENVRKYHSRMYIPQNMVFCVVGDIDVNAVLDRVQADFANFRAETEVDHNLPEVAPFGGIVRTTLSNQHAEETTENLCFQTVSLLHDDLYALDVLSFILSEGRSSRLVQSLQEDKKLVTGIDTSSWTPEWGKGMFEIYFHCPPEKADQAEQTILDELKKIIADGVNDAELARAKKQKVAEFVYSQQTVESIASMLAGDYIGTGNANFSKNYTASIQGVTAAQVKQVAAKYFRFDRMVITRMTPQPESQPATDVAQASRPAAASQTVNFTLPNGLRVVLGANNSVGLVAMSLATRGGLLLETKENNGIGTLMTSLSTKGAGDMDSKQIADFFDNAGGGIGSQCGKNTFLWSASVFQESFPKAMEIFASVVLHPTYPQKELDIIRPRILAGIKNVDQDRSSAAGKFFRQKFFGDTPYGLMENGTQAVVEKATAAAVKSYHDAHILAGDSVLAVFGNFDPQKAKVQIQKLFADMPEGINKLQSPERRKVADGGEVYVLPRPGESAATIYIGLPGMVLSNLADRFAMDVLETIISGYHYPSGWLHNELRGKQLVYAVHAWNAPGLAPGQFNVMAECQPEAAPQVVEIIRKNLTKASGYQPPQDEIDESINVILTAELLNKQKMSDLASTAALEMLYYNRDLRGELENLYRKVTPADVLRVGKKYLSGPFVLVVATSKPELFDPTDKPADKPLPAPAAEKKKDGANRQD